MREIKFRGIRTIEYGWAYGISMINNNRTYLKNPERSYLWIEVNAETVGQYTGVKDKNGVEVYEGDILIDREINEGIDISEYYPVVYNPDTCSYCIDNSFKKDGTRLVNMIEYLGIENIEVVGNVHNNPELLKN